MTDELSASDALYQDNPKLFGALMEYKDNNREEWENYFPGKQRLRDLSKLELALYSSYVKSKMKPNNSNPTRDGDHTWPHK